MGRSLLHRLILVGAFILVAHPVWASPKIVRIDFVGLSKVSKTEVLSQLTSLEGTNYAVGRVRKDIKALYQTGYFRDVSVSKQEDAGGVVLVFSVVEKGVIQSVVFEGNKKLKDKELLSAISIKAFHLLDEARIAESMEAIRKLYAEKGYFLVDVQHEIQPYSTETNELELIFKIRENHRVKVKRISFVGNRQFNDRKLAKQMQTKVKGMFAFITSSGKLKEDFLEQDMARLNYFYLTEGFIKVKIGKPQVSVTSNKQSIYVTIPVYEGPRYKMGDVNVDGDIITTREELLAELTLGSEEIYNRQLQDEDVNALSDRYGDQAYAFANVYPVLQTDDDARVAHVTYMVDKGPKILIENIIIKGNTVTRDKVIRRELQVTENAPYNRRGINQSRTRLMQLGYFADVNFATPRGTRNNTVDLIVTVEEKPTGTFSIGAGFSSLEAFIFSATVQKDNFFGYGISGALSTNISKLRQQFNFSYNDRYFFDTRWLFSLNLHRFDSALNRDFDQLSTGGSVTFGREVFPHFDLSVGYRIVDVSINNFSSLVPHFFRANSSGLTSAVLTNLAYDTRDNRLQTSKGMLHTFSNEYAGNGVGGDNDFWRMQFESRFFFPIWGKSILKARGLFGYIKSLNSNPVPLFDRYFLGGINTLRGFDVNTIGPELRIPATASGGDRGFTYGGTRMILMNAEYEIPIYDPAGIRTVIFIDAGQAFAETENISFNSLRLNYGAGLRWISPFGPLRFEWGFPINKRSGESTAVFNFSIGQSF